MRFKCGLRKIMELEKLIELIRSNVYNQKWFDLSTNGKLIFNAILCKEDLEKFFKENK
jgi:hypothetical protein